MMKRSRLSQSLLAATAMAGALALAGPARAQDAPGGFAAGLFSLFGMGSSGQPDIEYRERPPLVVPPRSTLPPPQEREATRARANWPNDPDVAKRRAAAEEEGSIFSLSERGRMTQDNVGRMRLSPDELARGRIDRPDSTATPLGATTTLRDDRMTAGAIMFEPMRQMREIDAQRSARAQAEADRPVGREPPRRFLHEPPPGLRAPTQRVAAPAAEPVVRPAERDLGIQDFNRSQARR